MKFNKIIKILNNKILMSKKLTHEFIALRTKCDRLEKIKNLNLWGNDIDDVTILKQMPNLEVVSLSVNKIKTLKDFASLKKLKELYLRKNFISNLSEVRFLINCTNLKVLWLGENPVAENKNYRKFIIKTLPQIHKLDDNVVTTDERTCDADLEENTKNAPSEEDDDYLEKNNFIIKNEVNTDDSNNYIVTKVIESDDDNNYNKKNQQNGIRTTESNQKKEVYSIKEKNKKIKDKFSTTLSRNNSLNRIDEKYSKKNNDESLNDDENYDNFKDNININNRENNKRTSEVDLPAGQTRHFLKQFQNQLHPSNQNLKKNENSNINQNNNKIQSKRDSIKKKSHNILSSILLLIQEMNHNDLLRARDEIDRILN